MTTVRELYTIFPDEETARAYLEARLWPLGTACPECNTRVRITARKGGFYRCNACKMDFTVRTGTIFERSHIPLHKWVYAMFLMGTAPADLSSPRLAKEIGITQKSAWYMLRRLREAFGSEAALEQLRSGGSMEEGTAEARPKRLKAGREAAGKTIAIAGRQLLAGLPG